MGPVQPAVGNTWRRPARFSATALSAIGAAAVLVRVFNLGTFSMWLDEILLVERASGSFAQVWAACVGNGEHPPLSAFLLNLAERLGASEAALRLVPIAAAVAGLLLLIVWAARVFGHRVGVLAGVVAALSPFHLRYSQELRPYAFLLLIVGLALVAGERVLDRPRASNVAMLAAVLAAGLYTHVLALLLLAPLAARAVERGRQGPADTVPGTGRRLTALGIAAGAAAVAWAPWLVAIRHVAERAPAGGVRDWNLDHVARRWQFLFAGVNDGDAMTWAGVLLAMAALVGVALALRRNGGPTLLVGALVGTVGVELLLQQAGHWTKGRYDILGWPFLLLLVALGIDALWRLPGRWRVAGPVLLAVIVVGELRTVAAYDRYGRPHWDLVADAVDFVRKPGEPIFVENPWTEISLGYYLHARHPEAPQPVALNGDASHLRALWPPASCALYVTAGVPWHLALREGAAQFPVVAAYRHTDGANLYLLNPEVRGRLVAGGAIEIGAPAADAESCTDDLRVLPYELRREPEGRLAEIRRWLRGEPGRREVPAGRLDFDAASVPALAFGWSGPERTGDGTTFVWALGRRAILLLRRDRAADASLAFRAWAYAPPGTEQRVFVRLNGEPLGDRTLAGGATEFRLAAPAALWRIGDNQVELTFSSATRPVDLETTSRDRRHLAAAFDWLAVEDSSTVPN